MVILRMQGGLGNQMFIYALYKKLELLGKDVRVDLSAYREKKDKREYMLDAFNIKVKEASIREIQNVCGSKNMLIHCLEVLRYGRSFWRERYYVEDTTNVQMDVFDMDDVYLEGYWQSPMYFENIRKELLDDFIFPKLEEKEASFKMENMCSLHVRLTDYVADAAYYGNICTLEYYQQAISYVCEKCKEVSFYCFSDDIDSAKELLSDKRITNILKDTNSKIVFVSEDTQYMGNNSAIEDMKLMSMCRHHIIANSSFSWWGGYLGTAEDKIVVAPSRWNNANKNRDIWCEDWIKI